MSSVTRPRGPLPKRVYWVRRLLVLGLALGLVLGISRFLGVGSDPTEVAAAQVPVPGDGAREGATSASGEAGATTSSETEADATPTERPGAKGKKRRSRRTPTPLAAPTGPCADEDVKVVPSVAGTPFAGSDVTITLSLTTRSTPACTWEVSAESVVVRLTSGGDRIWSTQDCPTAVPRQSVVVRKAEPTTVDVVWSGQRSDSQCSRTTLWAHPGYYHATAAALGAEPRDRQFRLYMPPRPTITPSPVVPAEEDSGRERGRERRSQQESGGSEPAEQDG